MNTQAYLNGEREYTRSRIKAKSRKKGLFSTLFIAFLVFGVFACLVFGYQGVFVTERYLNDIKDQITEIEIQNEKLQSQIALSDNLSHIQEVAREKLHMDFPTDDQIRYVKLIEPDEQELAKEVEGMDVFTQLRRIFD